MTTTLRVGHALKARREQRGWSVARASREARVPTNELQAIERGRRGASVAVLQRIAGALGVSLSQLVRGGGNGQTKRSGLDVEAIGRAIAELPDGIGSKVEAAVAAAVAHAMELSGGNQSESARLLAMDRKKFIRRLMKARRRKKR